MPARATRVAAASAAGVRATIAADTPAPDQPMETMTALVTTFPARTSNRVGFANTVVTERSDHLADKGSVRTIFALFAPYRRGVVIRIDSNKSCVL